MTKKLLALLFTLLAAPAAAQTIPSGVWGSINYWGVGGASQVLAPGLAGQCLQTQAVGSAPIWATCFALPAQNTNTFLGNVGGSFAAPVPVDVNAILNTVGYDIARPPLVESILYKSNVGPTFNWQTLAPGATGSILTSGGASNPPFWSPTPTQSNLASICQTIGALLYFDTPSLLWKCLVPGTAGQSLQTNGAGANPSFGAVGLTTGVAGVLPIANGGTGTNGVLNTQTSNYTIATTDCGVGKTIQAGTGATGIFTVTLPSASGFPSNCVITITNGDTGRGKTLSGFPSPITTLLWSQQTVQVAIVNGAWTVQTNPGKWRPTSAVVFNVSTTGADAGDCLGTGAFACATGQFVMNLVCQNVDPSLLPASPSPQITIQYATGAYTQTINSFCDPGPIPFVGSTQNGWLKIAGNTNLTSVTLNCGASTCFSPVHSTAGWWVEGFATSGTAYSAVADAGSHLYLGINSFGTTGATAGDVNAAYGSLVEFETNFTTTGNKSQFVSTNQSGSRVIFKPVTVTLSLSTFTTFYTANTNAEIIAQGVTYSGTATVGANGCWVVNTGGGLDTAGNLAPVTTACSGQTHNSVNPGWAQ